MSEQKTTAAAASESGDAAVLTAEKITALCRHLQAHEVELTLSLGNIAAIDTHRGLKELESLRALAATQAAVIAQHNLCHDLHGKVDAKDFAAGCAAEQRRIYGESPHLDEVYRLRATVATQAEETERLRAALCTAWSWMKETTPGYVKEQIEALARAAAQTEAP